MMKNNMQEETKTEVKEVIAENKYISIDDFAKVEIKLGTIMSAEVIEGSEKLYKLSVDFGEEKTRTVFSGIRKFVTTEDLIGKQLPFVTNLEPRKMMGEYSEAMILAASEGEMLALLTPTQKLSNGVKLR
jgi:methionyl-tRNA synthetase